MSEDAPDDDALDAELVAETLRAIANTNRIKLLMGLYEGRSRTDITDQLPISDSGVSNHLRTLADAGFVYKAEQGWQVTPLGEYFAIFIETNGAVVADAQRLIADAREDAREEYTEIPLPESERERTVEWRAWELVRDDLENLIDE